jgi:hypothetical protein
MLGALKERMLQPSFDIVPARKEITHNATRLPRLEPMHRIMLPKPPIHGIGISPDSWIIEIQRMRR